MKLRIYPQLYIRSGLWRRIRSSKSFLVMRWNQGCSGLDCVRFRLKKGGGIREKEGQPCNFADRSGPSYSFQVFWIMPWKPWGHTENIASSACAMANRCCQALSTNKMGSWDRWFIASFCAMILDLTIPKQIISAEWNAWCLHRPVIFSMILAFKE